MGIFSNVACCGSSSAKDVVDYSQMPREHVEMSSRSGNAAHAHSRRKVKQDEDFIYDCKAAYHVIFDDVEDEITSKDQLADVLQQSGRNPSRKVIRDYWKGKNITFEEFCDICQEIKQSSTTDLLKAFKRVDLNGDGFIQNSELRRMLTSKGEKMTEAEVAAIIEEVDANGDGKLDYKEFCDLLLSTQNEVKKIGIAKMEKRHGKQPRRTRDDVDESHQHHKKNDSPIAKPRKYENTHTKSSDGKKSQYTDKFETKPKLSSGSETDSDSDLIVIPGKTKKAAIDSASAANTSDRDLKPRPRPRLNRLSDDDDTSPREHRARPRTAIKDLNPKLGQPKHFKDWQSRKGKGVFLFEDDGSIVTHHYNLQLPEDSSVWVTIEPNRQGDRHKGPPVDTMLYVLREDNTLITFTEHRNDEGKYGVRCDLEKGRYKLIPFTTGCHLKRRHKDEDADDSVELVKRTKGKVVLTRPFKEALGEIFRQADLDDDGLLSKQEFSLYNLRSSGEEAGEDIWEVVEENAELEQGKLTLEGFLKLNEMEADDAEEDPEELWVTLSSWGYNKSLKQDEACPFKINVHAEECNFELSPAGLAPGGRALEAAIIEATKGKGEKRKVRDAKDVFVHTYQTDYRACLVLENKSNNRVSLMVDCSKSKNCLCNKKRLNYKIEVPQRSSLVAMHLMPQNESKEWLLNIQESIE